MDSIASARLQNDNDEKRKRQKPDAFAKRLKMLKTGERKILWKPGRVAWFRCEIAATAALVCASMDSDVFIGLII